MLSYDRPILETGIGCKKMNIYSNCDHELDAAVAAHLRSQPTKQAHHNAWNFNALISWDGDRWVSEVWQHHALVDNLIGEEIMDVIEEANEKYGSN